MRPRKCFPAPAGFLLAGVLATSACTDRGDPLLAGRTARPEPERVTLAVECTATVLVPQVTCRPARSGTGAPGDEIVYGGQNQFVTLANGTPSVTADTFAIPVTVRNLLPQAIGTTDGVWPDSLGVRVFFAEDPQVTEGSGAVTVANADGRGIFLTAEQPFFRYVGLIPPDSTSPSRTWKFRFTAGVTAFRFHVYVSSPVRHAGGWIDVTPRTSTFAVGGGDTLKAVVRTALGERVIAPITWSSSRPDLVTVTPLPGDTMAVVHGPVRGGSIVTATSGMRTGSAGVYAVPDYLPSLVSVSGRQLMVARRNPDGSLAPAAPYVMRGVTWSPASAGTSTSPEDPDNAAVRRPEFAAWAGTDIPLMQAMNVNTVRLFMDPGLGSSWDAGLAVLDQLHAAGIMVVMTVDDAINDTARVREAVRLYRTHPALLMWMVGNEWNISRYYDSTRISLEDAALRTERAAALIQSLDADHPVSTSYGEIDIPADGLRLADTQRFVQLVCPSVDVWGLNIYRGRGFWDLFQQWASISSKPMFVSEFGTDAFRSTALVHPPPGAVDEAMQADWDLNLWKDLHRNLSALDPAKVAVGGTVFAWNDEWWKVQPAGSQQTGGFIFNGHPDRFANEEWFGIVDIGRALRQVYSVLATAYAPGHAPGPPTLTLQAVSRGGLGIAPQAAFAEFRRDSVPFYFETGGAGHGRGFNVAVVDPQTGAATARNFDTWATRDSGTAMNAMVAYLQGLADGLLVMVAVGDEAGLNAFDTCDKLPHPWIEPALQALEALGSTQIRGYCYHSSWSMIFVQGEGAARAEQLGAGVQVLAQEGFVLQ